MATGPSWGRLYLIDNPKQDIISSKELDKMYELDYTREVHPYYAKLGKVKAQETIKFSITGCFGECDFCSKLYIKVRKWYQEAKNLY